jgi:hypothetical protein
MGFDWDAKNTSISPFTRSGQGGRTGATDYAERGEKIRVVTAYPMSKRLEAIYFLER